MWYMIHHMIYYGILVILLKRSDFINREPLYPRLYFIQSLEYHLNVQSVTSVRAFFAKLLYEPKIVFILSYWNFWISAWPVPEEFLSFLEDLSLELLIKVFVISILSLAWLFILENIIENVYLPFGTLVVKNGNICGYFTIYTVPGLEAMGALKGVLLVVGVQTSRISLHNWLKGEAVCVSGHPDTPGGAVQYILEIYLSYDLNFEWYASIYKSI